MSNTVDPVRPRSAVERAIEALIKLLDHNDPSVRAEAAKAILDARRDGIA